MTKILCQLEHASTNINGIEFVPHEDGISLISKDEVGEPLASIFLSIPGYLAFGEIDEDSDDKKPAEPAPAPAAPAAPAETPAQRKARLKAEEKAAAEKVAADKAAAEKEAADKAAADAAEAARLAAEEEAANAGNEGEGDEVF